jgi:lysozyme
MTQPKITRPELIDKLKPLYPALEDEILIIGIRGYYKNSMGKTGVNDRSIYDDAIIIMTDNEFHTFNANCDPSAYRKGIASLNPGVWRVYKFDIHGGRSSQYPAICQRAGVVTVTRDGGKVDTGMFGINIHKGGYKGTSSEGCQTIHPDQWQRFYSTMERLAKSIYGDKYKSQVYAYVLINN